MSRWRRLTVPAAVAALGLAACGGGGSDAIGDEGPPALAGRTFLSEIGDSGGDRALVPGTRITLAFEDDGLRASAGCNTMGGPWALEGSTLVLSEMSVTEMGCDRPRYAQDEWLWGFLGARPEVSLAGEVLTLTAEDTVIELLDREVADPDRPLVGTTWRGDSIVEGETVFTSAAVGDVSLVLAENGTFSVSTGCNEGGGRVEVGERTLTFGELALTARACPGVDEVEAAVIAVFAAGEVGFSIEGPVLTLTAGDRGLVLRATQR